ncbi:sodium- and chloride-dependent glycine transporter 2 [Copidosoma floridanum]|uniref:sodium- and chloride-dependent glycine transporter 2 n=1 Tax=Copidosoma floridanum TaxID=29053 RepID=UPI0006C99B17|nr:sodium- and chloride-dependent glycine transporter 2 [Copidosoma floridanum]
MGVVIPGMVAVPNERQGWASPVEFVLSCIGYAVGIGNIWRFPFLVYRSGGGAFLIPFVLILLVMGLPIFFLELVVGQYSGLGPTEAYARMAPIFQGLGYCTIVVITFVTIYYMVLTSWMLFYFFASFLTKLPWSTCLNDFNSANCYSEMDNIDCQKNGKDLFFNGTCRFMAKVCQNLNHTSSIGNFTHCFDPNTTPTTARELRNLSGTILSTSSEEYFYDRVLGVRGADWEHWGGFRWELFGCLTICWIVCYFCLIKGVQSVGKVVYFTALFPYFVLIALMIRGATLEGAADGILWFITPQWDQLANARVWADAASQVFYSLGIGCGSLITLASYSSFTNNSHRDAVFVTLTNLLTSIFAGFVTFSVMGFLKHQTKWPIDQVVRSDTGLAFVAFPEAVVRMPLPNMWAVLFFFMLFILGLGSQLAGVQAISGAIMDSMPQLRKHEAIVILGVCFTCWLAAIPMLFDGGIYLFTLMDWNTASWAILLIGVAELVVPAWLYGWDKLVDNLDHMQMRFGPVLRLYWRISWQYLAPISALGIFAYQMYSFQKGQLRGIEFPWWADAIGVMIGLATLAPMPIGFCFALFQKLKDTRLFKPKSSWGPAQKSLKGENKPSTINPTFIPDA